MNGMREISIVTLGVENLTESMKFYQGLGFRISKKSDESIVWFRTGSTVLGLYPMDRLAEDATISAKGSGFGGVVLAMNMVSKAEVDRMIDTARTLGAKVLKEPGMVFWGGYSSYFEDPDGHLWEVAWNPFTEVDADGRLKMDD
ncbi:MAG: Glyoxalase-like domain protein [Methanomassiliicoccales archaeon PtaU1.Bin124]|nr:MAG: Glyoxalase-like domain protein [Methanomassiliicoccales archaeon PtaU1.Bin124]